ncbi:lipopolysaccharide biosynthesis protein RfbH [Candidatus Parcubacteria bacterium]|nr:lipopolysaccharide biosynthesis protein RfbH [Candidatus Parcubacteria bacterium]
MTQEQLKKEIFWKVQKYHKIVSKRKTFIPGKNFIPASGAVFNEKEMISLVNVALDRWFTEGKFAKKFEQKFSKFLNVPHTILTNSGSSANLLAFSALFSPQLGEKRIRQGDEVITVAAAFPTTINPIIQNGCIPVFLDIDLETLNVDLSKIEKAITKKTKVIFLAHNLGNPFDLKTVIRIAKKYNLFVIEDACDALGSTYDHQLVGTFGDISTFSFYPAHHITMGEGGALITRNSQLNRIIRSLKDWGRHCWCPTGKDNTCNRRFKWQLGKLPYGYDHKYTYSHIGYNLKLTDMQAAIGVSQMGKLRYFIKRRKENFNYLYNKLKEFEKYFIFSKATKNSNPSWFGFAFTIKDPKKINRRRFMEYLNSKGIGTRLLFGGNITKQPYFIDYKIRYRQIGNLENTDKVMNSTFWIGLYPGLNKQHFDYISGVFKDFLSQIK